jgi:hypothetical protein
MNRLAAVIVPLGVEDRLPPGQLPTQPLALRSPGQLSDGRLPDRARIHPNWVMTAHRRAWMIVSATEARRMMGPVEILEIEFPGNRFS